MITSELVLGEQAQRVVLHGLHWTASTIELFGVAVIIAGVVGATAWSLGEMRRGRSVKCGVVALPMRFAFIGPIWAAGFCSVWSS